MENNQHYKKLENMYHNHPLNKFYRAKISISENESEIILPIQDKFHHAASAVHGSVYWKILDDSAYFSVNSIVKDVFVLTASYTIYLLSPISTGTLIARGKLVSSTKSQFIAESVIINDLGEQIARGNGVYIRSKMKLDLKMGYKL
jgi:acyl-coenzyme A thioesterase PaaI-like protein